MDADANILVGRCSHECRTTWREEHGGAKPGGPFPGTYANPGDVRVCEHGSVWLFDEVVRLGYGTLHDRWRRVSRFGSPLIYRRAKAALNADGAEPDDA